MLYYDASNPEDRKGRSPHGLHMSAPIPSPATARRTTAGAQAVNGVPRKPSGDSAAAVQAAVFAAIAVAAWLVFRHTLVSSDATYSLVWAKEALHGNLPDYSGGPAPHPLVNLIALPLVALGDHADDGIVVLNSLALAGLLVVVFNLSRAWFGLVSAILAVLLLMTRPSIVLTGVVQYADTLAALLYLGAVLALSRRPQATWGPLALLGIAGLIRPEAWFFAAVLAIVRLRGPDRPPVLALALAVAAPAVIWTTADLIVTGDPLYSFVRAGGGTEHHAPSSAQVTHMISSLPARLSETIGKPELLVGVVGALLVAWRLRGRSVLILAGLGLPLMAALGEAVLGLPVIGRYLFSACAMLMIFAAVPMGAHRLLPEGRAARAVWLVAAVGCAAVLVAFGPDRISGVRQGRASLAVQHAARDDAQALLTAHAPSASCGPIAVTSLRLVPQVRYWLERPDGTVVTAQMERPSRGTYLVPARPVVRRAFNIEQLIPKDDPRQRLTYAPPGFRVVARNRSWSLAQRCNS